MLPCLPPNHDLTDDGSVILNGAETLLSELMTKKPDFAFRSVMASLKDAAVPLVMTFPLMS